MDTEATVPEGDEQSDQSRMAFSVVGIGASAGGLEAIRELVKSLPSHIDAAYVVVQHMSPDHKSLLTTLIGRETHLSVRDITSGMELESNVIYVTPPNSDVVLRGRILTLQEPSNEPAAPKPSVDRFFISAAESFKDRSVGVVLSGTGSDGAYGIQAIREAGGITIAQDDRTAKYDGMPIAAVETGCVDLVLSPMQIGTHLERILNTPRDLEQFRTEEVSQHPLADLLQIVLAKTRVDFREYKPTTVQRRLERRMTALGISGQREYTSYCRSNPREIDALFKDLLISVTRFFRDPKEFFAVTPFISKLIEDSEDQALRVWVAGCATGEEAYSIAMLFAEALGGIDKLTKDRIQIFATDIDKNALAVARRGRYSLAVLDDIPDEFVNKYFIRSNDNVAVHPNLKDVILFSEHNIFQDPPFLNLHMICCRNLLIYFGVALQIKVLSRLHYSMRPDGALFLGTAETVSVSEELFKPVSSDVHLYRKRYTSSSIDISKLTSVSHKSRLPKSVSVAVGAGRDDIEVLFDRSMFDELANSLGPNGLLLSDDYRIVRVYGDMSRYLTLTEKSRLQFNVSVLKPILAQEVRSLITIALKKRERRTGIIHRGLNGDDHLNQLEVYPLKAPALDEGFALVVFKRWKEPDGIERPKTEDKSFASAEHIETLELELRNTQDELQQTIERLETLNEELQASNEELQSTNEELQAANEELETSNEELQSTNEELVTVNEELQVSTAELSMMADEQDAVLSSVASPLLIVDVALQVTKANDAAVALFRIRRSVERPHLSQLYVPPGFPLLSEICNEAIQLGKPLTQDIQSQGLTYTMQCTPYSNQEGRLRGATMMFLMSPTG